MAWVQRKQSLLGVGDLRRSFRNWHAYFGESDKIGLVYLFDRAKVEADKIYFKDEHENLMVCALRSVLKPAELLQTLD